MSPLLSWLIFVLAITTEVRGGSYHLRRIRNVPNLPTAAPHPTTVMRTTKHTTIEPSELLVAQESRLVEKIVTAQPSSDGESSRRQEPEKAVTPHLTTPEPPTTRKPVTHTHNPKLLELLKKSAPRSKSIVLNPESEKTTNDAVNKIKISKPERDPLLASGSSPRGARFFSSAASMLSSFVPAVAPPTRRARCASPDACLVQQIMEAINATMMNDDGPEPRPIIESQSGNKRITPQRRTLQRVAATTTASVESSTKPAIFSRIHPRRRDHVTSTTVSTPTTTPTTPEPRTSSATPVTSDNSRKPTFRKFRILESKTPTTPAEIGQEVTTTSADT